MAMIFPYQRGRSPQPVISLNGRLDRPRPYVSVCLVGPANSITRDCLLDAGADDTVFYENDAVRLGVDLTQAPPRSFAGVGGQPAILRYAQVTFRLTNGIERREWQAWVGFTSTRLATPLLGFAGFLQYFTATFHGDHEEVELAINTIYPGT